MLATITVSTNVDGPIDSSNSNVTLREAIAFVNGDAFPSLGERDNHISGIIGENDRIEFASSLNGATIRLQYIGQQTAALSIFQDVTIDATMLSQGLTLDARETDLDTTPNNGNGLAVMQVGSSVISDFNATLAGLTFTGGDSPSFAGGLNFLAETGTLTVLDCKFFKNYSVGAGVSGVGGLYALITTGGATSGVHIERTEVSNNEGVGSPAGVGGAFISVASGIVDIVDTTISGNKGSGKGGGLYVFTSGSASIPTMATIRNSRITGNTSQMAGGGFFAYFHGTPADKLLVLNSTISGNHALTGVGGGGYACTKYGGQFEATNSTFSDNEALDPATGRGGGLAISRQTLDPLSSIESTLNHLTITDNRATNGGGLFSLEDPLVETFVNHTIISNNRDAAEQHNNVAGSIEVASSRFNFFGTDVPAVISGLDASNFFNNDPMLEALAYYGGPTAIHLPKSNSPVIDKVPDSSSIDQRNFVRPVDILSVPNQTGQTVDIGAVERQTNDPWNMSIPGDYNRDGAVDSADYTAWRNTKFSTTVLWADGNNDGEVNVTDFAIWKTNFGRRVNQPGAGAGGGSYLPGDINRDGTVDMLDRGLWLDAYGFTTVPEADLNYNGIVDLADLEVWQGMQGATLMESLVAFGDLNNDLMIDSSDLALCEDASDTALVTANFGLVRADVFPEVMRGTEGMPLNLQFAAPVVLEVAVGSTNLSTVAGSGEQLRSVAAANPNLLSVRFSEEVLVMLDALQVTNLDGISPGEPSIFEYDLATQTATWTYSEPLADGRYVLRLADSVFDLSHDALDGEFFNPISLGDAGSAALPSGDGDAGGEFRFRFTVLAGDTDHNNIHGAANYQNWHSTEPGMIIVSTTTDDFDGNLSFGDVSLREAVNYANTAGTAMAIQLPAGRYTLSRTGTESSADVSVNDLDILADVSIVGLGPGFTVIDNSGLAAAGYNNSRTFELNGVGKRLRLSSLTIANGSTLLSGQVANVINGAALEIEDSALVNHTAYAGGTAISVTSANVSVVRSVLSNNDVALTYGGAAIQVSGTAAAPASIIVEESVFAQNVQPGYVYQPGNVGPATRRAITTIGTVTKINNGKNLYDDATGGFFDTTPGEGDHLGSVDYVVTSVADTWNHADNLEALSIREAVDLANQAAGIQTIWIPAWRLTLTRDRGTNATDTNVSYGDLDINDSLAIRGVADRTSVEWKSGVVDKVFDLLGDYNGDGEVDTYMPLYDWEVWDSQYFQSGAWEQFAADGDDDGDVDVYDEDIWAQNLGHTLQLFNLSA